MKLILSTLLLLLAGSACAQDLTTRFERTRGLESAPYEEVIAFYRLLDRRFPTVDIRQTGPTDAAFPLHVVYFSPDGRFDIQDWKKQGKTVLLINNGIHPGEPDGIDASMMLLRDAALGKMTVPGNVVLAVIPVFNISGALNRGSFSRANQNGPQAYGFRGNAQYLDLNRDFIKMDARETQSLVQLFHKLDPDLFIDNHVSNGADYQHVMTLLSGNAEKLGKLTGAYLKEKLEPAIYASMKEKGYDLVPYVNHWGHTPEQGWKQFYDLPRFASGFATLFSTFAFVPETHMLKSYPQRVAATYDLMRSFIEYAGKYGTELQTVRANQRSAEQKQQQFVLDWKVDTTHYTSIPFLGYKSGYKRSDVSGKDRLYYDRSQPYSKQVRYYNKYVPALTALAPRAYVLPGGWHRVAERLKMNGVRMKPLERDTVMVLTVYRIRDYETSKRPYEGHYLHNQVKYDSKKEKVRLYKGDYLIPLRQPARRYLIETLEPGAPDAFFAWGFFDAILQQKEHFSDYVFEDLAAELLKQDPGLRRKLETRKKEDPAFAADGQAQLDFVYRNSPYYEPGHLRYPVYRLD